MPPGRLEHEGCQSILSAVKRLRPVDKSYRAKQRRALGWQGAGLRLQKRQTASGQVSVNGHGVNSGTLPWSGETLLLKLLAAYASENTQVE